MSNSTPRYADVILPLALEGLLTYLVPEDWPEDHLQSGSHVVVSLGKRKQLSGIIFRIHQNPPIVQNVKPLESYLGMALSGENQISFWRWMSKYYMCLPGEVMSAALPTRLKLSSESIAVFSEKAEREYAVLEDEMEQTIMAVLRENKQLKISELSKSVPRNFTRTLKDLVQRDFVTLKESIHEPDPQFFYQIIEWAPGHQSLLEELLEGKKAPAQKTAAIELHDYLQPSAPPLILKDFLKNTGVKRNTIKALEEKGIITLREVERASIVKSEAVEPLYPLSPAQSKAYRTIKSGFFQDRVQFLHGVTASGKTEIYAHLIAEALNEGKQCLYLLPEIALTTQLIFRIQRFFGDRVSVYHSRMSEKERSDVWESVRKGLPGADIVIGARSAIFLPFSRLGLIVVDEEHDSSYKQTDPAPRYNGRDSAIVLGKIMGAKVLLGSATPALETWQNCLEGRFDRVPLEERYSKVQMPAVELVDIGWEKKKKNVREDFTLYLIDAIKSALNNQKQVIIFHNRRGYTPFTQCRDCGESPMCINCDVTLTYHKHSHKMRCHICGYKEEVVGGCKSCGSTDLRMSGAGTEKIVDQLNDIFPDVIIDRLDWDNTRKKNAFAAVIDRFSRGETKILVGTQMITKGLDFKNVELVGIINADIMMNMPEIRARERAYQLVMQVAGRAGRFGERGKVIIQTYKPEDPVMQCVAADIQERFYTDEMQDRKDFAYPPYTKLVRLCLRHADVKKLYATGYALKEVIQNEPHLKMLGPEPPLITRAKNQFRLDFLIKYRKDKNYGVLKERLRILTSNFFRQNPQVRHYFDVDPW
ncbi:MAG: primosomal protein N' [Cryomorphaceae bacterium]|nr:primosomal protein N' [Cryomorphaceae bacterium]